eukprot:GHVS01033383.1.p1 GENE.GHVS01033383.1~~GHVS01033383.1.p1  ORF type:complete len:713 (+),score=151.89 GHVS01033383.1:130-2268(+)
MFKKTFRLGGKHYIGKKEKKKLKASLQQEAVGIAADDPSLEVWTGGEEVMEASKVTGTNCRCTVYVLPSSEALLFESSSIGLVLAPTVYALWKCPSALACIVTHAPVSAFVMNGADLFLPGLIPPKGGYSSSFKAGKIVAIRVINNKFPFAVGRLLVNLDNPPSRGKAAEVLHWFGDFLWSMGPRTSPHPCFTPKKVSGAGVQPGDDAFEPADASNYDCWYTAAEAAAAGSLDATIAAGINGQSIGQTDDGWGYEDENVEEAREEEEEECSQEGGDMANREEGEQVEEEEKKQIEEEDEEEESADQEEEEEEADEQTAGSVVEERVGCVAPKLDLTPEQLDEVLEICLLEALHVAVTDEQLPLDASALYSKMVAASEYIISGSAVLRQKLEGAGMTLEQLRGACSADLSLDVKKSTHKKLSKFLQTYSKKKWFQTKETRGVVFIVKVNRDHPTYKVYPPVPTKDRKVAPTSSSAAGGTTAPTASEPTTAAVATGELVIMEFFQPSQKCLPIFAAVGTKTGKDQIFSRTQCSEVLSNYVQKVLPDNLPQSVQVAPGNSVPIDFNLRAAVVAKSEGSIPDMTKKELFERFQSEMKICHKVYRTGDSDGQSRAPLRKGPVPPVKITIGERSGGRKHITHIVGLSTFHVDQAAVAGALQKQLACSASTYELPGKIKELAIMVQGRSGTQSAEFLVSECSIPKKYIQVESKGKDRHA